MYFYYSPIISTLRRMWPLIWTNLYPLHLGILCTKFGWNWPSGSWEEDDSVKSLQTDRQTTGLKWSEKLTWAFSSGELKIRNHRFDMENIEIQLGLSRLKNEKINQGITRSVSVTRHHSSPASLFLCSYCYRKWLTTDYRRPLGSSLSVVLRVFLTQKKEKHHLNSTYPQSHCLIRKSSWTVEWKRRISLSLLSLWVFLLLTPNCSGNSRVSLGNCPICSRSEVSHLYLSSLKMSCPSTWLEPYTPHTWLKPTHHLSAK